MKLVGKHDGFLNGQLVELKRRMKPINMRYPPPEYDMIQCMVYMSMTCHKTMMLIEEGPAGTPKRETQLEFDSTKWGQMSSAAIDILNVLLKKISNQLWLAGYVKAVTAQETSKVKIWAECDTMLLSNK